MYLTKNRRQIFNLLKLLSHIDYNGTLRDLSLVPAISKEIIEYQFMISITVLVINLHNLKVD